MAKEARNKPSVRMPYVSVLIDRAHSSSKDSKNPSLERNQEKLANEQVVKKNNIIKPPPLDLAKVIDN